MIIRVGRRARYTNIDNRAIEDPNLSFQALGVLTYLLSKPDHWEANYRHLATVRTSGDGYRGEGEHAVRQALSELERRGYLVRERRQAAGGRFEWVAILYEVPPCGDPRGMDNRGLDPRGVEDRGEVKPEGAITEAATTEPALSSSQKVNHGEPAFRDPSGPARARAALRGGRR